MDNNQMKNTVSNPETEVPKDTEMNDSDYLNDILSMEKHYGSNYAVVMNEASNDDLYNVIGTLCKETKDIARSSFNLQFKKGWYRLDKADENKISNIKTEYSQKLNELQ